MEKTELNRFENLYNDVISDICKVPSSVTSSIRTGLVLDFSDDMISVTREGLKDIYIVEKPITELLENLEIGMLCDVTTPGARHRLYLQIVTARVNNVFRDIEDHIERALGLYGRTRI